MAMETSSNYGSYVSRYANAADSKKKTAESGAAEEGTETGKSRAKRLADAWECKVAGQKGKKSHIL